MRSVPVSCLVFAVMLIALGAIFLWVPTEKEMGIVQRIFYFHVPSAFSSFLAFFLVFIGSIQYLRTREDKWDRLALGAAELGVIFALIVLITGPLWAKPVWGVYWRWEPRLTSMLIMFTIYAAYLMVRGYGAHATSVQRTQCCTGHSRFRQRSFGVLCRRSVGCRPTATSTAQCRARADDAVYAKWICYAAFFLLLFYLLAQRMELARIEKAVALLRQKLTDET